MLDATAHVPTELRHDSFFATPLTCAHAALDYAAYMASPDVIRVHSDGRWPVDDFTLAEDERQIAQHERDHEARRAFAFVLLDPAATEALGCVYLNPLHPYLQRVGAAESDLAEYRTPSAMVTFWVRQDRQDGGLPRALVDALVGWLRDDWPLRRFLVRALPAERTSCAALDQSGLRRVGLALPREHRPYRWYAQA